MRTPLGAWLGDGHMFTTEDGRAFHPSYVNRVFNRLRGQVFPGQMPDAFHGS